MRITFARLTLVALHCARVALRSGPPATGLRKPKSPKSAGESAGKSAGKRGTAGGTVGNSAVPLLFLRQNRPPGTVPSSPHSSPPFFGTLPSTLPSTFGGFGLSQSCSRRPRSQRHCETISAIPPYQQIKDHPHCLHIKALLGDALVTKVRSHSRTLALKTEHFSKKIGRFSETRKWIY